MSFLEIKKRLPVRGIGLGYRSEIAEETIAHRDSIDFLELISEHYLNESPSELVDLDRVRQFSLIPHGIELSIGNVADLDFSYLKKLKKFLQRIDAPWWSDHLCFTGAQSNRLHDLLPLPYSREAVKHVVQRIKIVQDLIERPLLLENISAYLSMPGGEMSEQQFLSEIVEQSDCGILLDVNNVYVNSINQSYDAAEFIRSLPLERVVQIHIAGHRKKDSILIDTHGAKVSEPVYELLKLALGLTEPKAILLERDQLFPRFSSILAEIRRIRSIATELQPTLLPGLEQRQTASN